MLQYRLVESDSHPEKKLPPHRKGSLWIVFVVVVVVVVVMVVDVDVDVDLIIMF
jgi:hypothetical protein